MLLAVLAGIAAVGSAVTSIMAADQQAEGAERQGQANYEAAMLSAREETMAGEAAVLDLRSQFDDVLAASAVSYSASGTDTDGSAYAIAADQQQGMSDLETSTRRAAAIRAEQVRIRGRNARTAGEEDAEGMRMAGYAQAFQSIAGAAMRVAERG